jgi:hypothetical protein
MAITFNNQLTTRRNWRELVLLRSMRGFGVLFEELTLEAQIGPEVVALLIDRNPDELRGKGSLSINLNAGVFQTPFGPVLFLIWWIPPIVEGKPWAMYEQLTNPIHPLICEILRRLATQTHLHLLLLNEANHVQTAFEYPNTFAFENILAIAEQAKLAWTGPQDFQRATKIYQAEYDVIELFA